MSMEDLAPEHTPQALLRAQENAGRDNGHLLFTALAPDSKAPQIAGNYIQFMVPGKPQGKGRPRAVKRGKFIKMYTPEKTVTYESTVALAASQAMAGRPLMAGPVRVLMYINLQVPKSKPKKWREAAAAGRAYPITKPDADNVVKAVFDALNGVVWVDDTQVVALDLTKQYSAVPGVWVNVCPIVEAY